MDVDKILIAIALVFLGAAVGISCAYNVGQRKYERYAQRMFCEQQNGEIRNELCVVGDRVVEFPEWMTVVTK